MGGDGGTVTSNRRYLRGAGSASHTADAKRASSGETDAAAERERLRQTMTVCAITGAALDLRPRGGGGGGDGVSGGDIVACPYGRLYGREAAVEALLRRREAQQQQRQDRDQDQPEPDIGWHVRGLKDLHPVRFHVIKEGDRGDGGDANGGKGGGYVAACPMTGVELTGAMPAYLIVRRKEKAKGKKDKAAGSAGTAVATAADGGNDSEPNVLSERAIREVGADSLQGEYGPFDVADCVRLAPPSAGGVFERIKSDLERRREEERLAKKAGKKKKGGSEHAPNGDNGKKRKKGGSDGDRRENGGRASSNSAVAAASSSSRGNGPVLSSVASGPGLGKRPKHGGGGLADAARSSVATAVASNPVLSSLFTDGRIESAVSEKEKKDNLFAR